MQLLHIKFSEFYPIIILKIKILYVKLKTF